MTSKMIAVVAALAVLNIVSLCLMGADKQRAVRGSWRISEKTLFISAALFGALGGCLGMFLFRHKTKHWYFRLFFLLVQAGVLGYVWAVGLLQ